MSLILSIIVTTIMTTITIHCVDRFQWLILSYIIFTCIYYEVLMMFFWLFSILYSYFVPCLDLVAAGLAGLGRLGITRNMALQPRLPNRQHWYFGADGMMQMLKKKHPLVGGDWNMAGLWASRNLGNVIIPTDFQSIIFQRGGSTTNQMTIINHH